jgi:hypothetical protein
MPCLVGCLALATPRFAIVLVVFFSDYIGRAYETNLWPFVGFLFMPLTTLAYAWAINSRGSVAGWHLAVVVVAVLVDLGVIGGSKPRRTPTRTGPETD